ncbi:MAG: hypothetical protein MJ252_10975 [archaeon]|nr:hypothetical protein [archaeon]
MQKELPQIKRIIITHVVKTLGLIPIQLGQCYLFSSLYKEKFVYSNIEGAFCLAVNPKTKNLMIQIIDTNTLEVNFEAEFADKFAESFVKQDYNFFTMALNDQILGFYFPQISEAAQIGAFAQFANADTISAFITEYEEDEKKIAQQKTPYAQIAKKVKDNMIKNEPKENYKPSTAPKGFNGKEIDFSTFNYPLMEHFTWNEEKKKFEFYEGKDTKDLLSKLKINPAELDITKENPLQVKNLDHMVKILVNHFTHELILAKNLDYFKNVYLEERQLKKKYENEIKRQFSSQE